MRKNREGTDQAKARKGILRHVMLRLEYKGRVGVKLENRVRRGIQTDWQLMQRPCGGKVCSMGWTKGRAQEELRRRCSSTTTWLI